MYNVYRDPKKQREPFKPLDFFEDRDVRPQTAREIGRSFDLLHRLNKAQR